jgi:hypothetical protein
MIKKTIVLIVLLIAIIGCTPDEPAEPAELPPAEATSDAAVNPVEEPEDGQSESQNPDLTIVPPSGSVDLGQITPDAASEGDGDLVVQPAPGIPDPEIAMVQLASQDLADRLGLDIGEITFVEAAEQDWPDSGLGCPSPDELYAAVITPGYQITLEAEGESYLYHTDKVENVVLCVDGQPADS